MGDTNYEHAFMDKVRPRTKGILQFTKSKVKQHIAFIVKPDKYEKDLETW